MAETVLLIEDEQDVVDLLRYNLNRAGFTVSIANNGLEGLEKARDERPEIIILDLMLPEMPGEKVCKALKEDASTAAIPIIMLTAKSQPEERIQGLELGADDYVPKPFSPKELVLRVQALLRRLRKSEQGHNVEVDEFLIDKATFEVRLSGERLDLTTTEFKLLTLLIERRGRVQSRETLLYDVWGYRNAIDTRTVDTHMRRLREKLGEHAGRIETVRGEGYRFTALLKP
ncbi:MAG TPA: response regulator transcription factor [Chthoniobacterales bacterium]|jgi:two-component system phosphate regulon response regulator PhoB|nr:response regulator transcription factor [Chthoniobacterales bacterium]